MLTVLMLFTIPLSDIRSPPGSTGLVYCPPAAFPRLRLSVRKVVLPQEEQHRSEHARGIDSECLLGLPPPDAGELHREWTVW